MLLTPDRTRENLNCHCAREATVSLSYSHRMNTGSIFITGRPIISLRKFCQQAGISNSTAWRWRKNGWLVTVNIYGRQYVTDKALAEFLRRAQAGEFARDCRPPKRKT